ncbi:hypothetical protein D5018_15590 [Parashewanella curva]|uniref:Beta-carotene 15,15'-monooxygenase n=1 Tax=Parashewanella curva TaxID=2338552 RepID=A0A3L8PWF1_9GAMM|nr:hypothetical protein [Parashewanella curva]RLV58768.1 hypothetical protein D5018_15590 [Parashewanella curva]
MLNPIKKQHIPFLFFALISLWWAYYYQSNTWLNEYGQAKFEWLYLLDGLISIPLICFLCIKDKKQALIKSISYLLLVILIGRFIIPEPNQEIWSYLAALRYLIIPLFLAFEIFTIFTVYLGIKAALSENMDPDSAITAPIEKAFSKGILTQLFSFEARIWTFALFANKVNPKHFKGYTHFSYHNKDGTQSNALGFILLFIFEIPIVHLLLHFIWSATAANVVTILTILGMVFFIAEYRALSRRPISIDSQHLYIRYGVFNPMEIELSNIEKIEHNQERIKRASHIKRYNLAGTPNIKLVLKQPIGKINEIYLGLDRPLTFINAINQKAQH